MHDARREATVRRNSDSSDFDGGHRRDERRGHALSELRNARLSKTPPVLPQLMFAVGICMEAISVLRGLTMLGICVPEQVTMDQARRVVVQYIDARPADYMRASSPSPHRPYLARGRAPNEVF